MEEYVWYAFFFFRMNKKKYGEEHESAKKEKAARVWHTEEKQCEITGKKDVRFNEHHNVPRFFNGPDMASNYITLDEQFHKYLHYICNVTRTKMVGKRIQLTQQIQKYIRDDEKREQFIREIDEIDKELIPEYIHNMMYNLPPDLREKAVEQSLISCFQTIRDMRIKIMELLAKNTPTL